MKLIHIIGILVLGIGIAVVISMYSNSSQYVSFEGAEQMALRNPDKNYHVIVELNKDKPMTYDPQKDPNRFEFYGIDSLGVERLVVYGKPKPQDFERTDKIVLEGVAKKDYFEAREILLKCPSKYNEEISKTETQ